MENNEKEQLLSKCIEQMNLDYLIACVDALDKEIDEYTQNSQRMEINSKDDLIYADGKLKFKNALIIGTTNSLVAEISNKRALKKVLRDVLEEFIHFDDYPDICDNVSASIRNIKRNGAELLVDFLTYMNNTYSQVEFNTLSSIRDALTERQLKLKK